MHWESYYIPPDAKTGDTFQITGDELHHLSRVKRKRNGDIIWAVDGQGSAYEAQLLSITKQEALCRILSTRRRLGEALTEITIAQSVIKGERFEWFLEKATEIGVTRFIPMLTERTLAKASGQKINRWKRIVLSAMKQCGRSVLPEITDVLPFEKVIVLGADCAIRLIADGDASAASPQIIQTGSGSLSRALILIGPEGGFTGEEIALAKENGFTPFRMGPRRLRSETAGLVLATLILSQSGDLE